MAFNNIHVLRPRICEYITVVTKWTLLMSLRLRTLTWRNYPALIWCSQYNNMKTQRNWVEREVGGGDRDGEYM